MIVKSVGALSLGKVLGVMYLGIGVIIGAVFSAITAMGFAFGAQEEAGLVGLLFGLGAILIFPIFYGACGLVGGIVGAAIYNVVSSIIGGVEIDVQ